MFLSSKILELIRGPMQKKELNVLAICNVLKDIVIKVSDQELAGLGLAKGIMHLVSEEEQQNILKQFDGREKKVEMGGSGPNVIRTLSVLGRKVSQAGMVGNDLYGELYINRVNELGIKNNIIKAETGSTGTSLILTTSDGERTMNTCLGMSRCYTTRDIPEADIANAEYLLVTGYQWDTDNQIEAINHALRIAKANNTKVVLDLSDPFCVDRHRDTFLNVIETYVDIVFSNLKEANMLTGQDLEGSLETLSALADIVVIKTGAEGSWIKTKTQKVKIKSNKVNVVDTTAAGDMYAGGFMYGLTGNLSIEECGKIASFCAETVIQQVGANIPDNLLELVQSYMTAQKEAILSK
jgi:sugar/nucleoside kinase (ribokinase family)